MYIPRIVSEHVLSMGICIPLRLEMIAADFFHRMAHPPQPQVSVDVGERQLSHTAVYE